MCASDPTCKRPLYAKGVCRLHYDRDRRERLGARTRTLPPGVVQLGTIRISEACADALDATGAESRTSAARLVLEAWARYGVRTEGDE